MCVSISLSVMPKHFQNASDHAPCQFGAYMHDITSGVHQLKV